MAQGSAHDAHSTDGADGTDGTHDADTARTAHSAKHHLGIARRLMIRHLQRAGIDVPVLEANILLACACGCSVEALYATAHDAPLPPAVYRRANRLARQRCRGIPLAYLQGYKEFYGRQFVVTPAVLIPRPQSEHIIDRTRELHAEDTSVRRIHDCGCGSGALAVTIKAELPHCMVSANDISRRALRIAQMNCARLIGDTRAIQWQRAALVRGIASPVDLVVANLPYLCRRELRETSIRREPRRALYGGGSDGISILRRLLATAWENIVPGGRMLLEASPHHMIELRRLAIANAYRPIATHHDLGGRERVLEIMRPVS